MAKKKKIIDLKNQNISYKENDLTYKLINFKTDIQKLEVAVYKEDTFVENKTVAFAHIPKTIKAKIKPLDRKSTRLNSSH